ncbi:receptor-type guanylate cyclase gcy-3-like [Copidosoma floridanum]|uniref:receptor-type guanylate cyclase gcy-3-like n=1 Tax=Copidosoma floridanum TaxID=29053 RepID=UPI0006C94CB8|nr:receptor-type guanylate cyclase gcy-3-like [Copidosoma floridanum]
MLLWIVIKKVDPNQCLTAIDEVNPKRYAILDGKYIDIYLEISRRVTQRLVTRVTKIFLQEVLGYPDVVIVEKEDESNITATFSRLYNPRSLRTPESMVNMEVWVPPQIDIKALRTKHDVLEAGVVRSPGYLGWFIPAKLFKINDSSWLTFTKQETAGRFDVDDFNLKKIMSATLKSEEEYYCQEEFCQKGMYIPPQCQSYKKNVQPCALLLSDYSYATKFIKNHIDHWKLYVKVAWVGPHLRQIVKSLTKEYLLPNTSQPTKSLVILHWTPSYIIPNQREFVNVDFPKCGSRGYSEGCEYELRRLEKFVWNELELTAKLAFEAINRIQFSDEMYENLINSYNEKLVNNFNNLYKSSVIEHEVACDWLKKNLNYTLLNWKPVNENKNMLVVGGIFPMTGSFYTAKSIVLAAKMAKIAINQNSTVLRDYNLNMLIGDGQCKSEMVLKSFIEYLQHPKYQQMIGILGPACSETIEPLAGVSNHYPFVIMSYSAEGSSLNDRTRYPYFFRTIGANRQYKYMYLELLKKFNWQRVAAFSEDGLKYTEYISYMQDLLRENGITFVANIKFPREAQLELLTNHLEDLKQKRAKIIISDVYDPVARFIMCKAYKLKMTAIQGYVWFLPPWLRNDWFDTDSYNSRGENTPCSTVEMKEAINGYLAISHANFAPDNNIMQEGKTVRQWRDIYERNCASQKESPSPYAGYAYDAMWTLALAADQLLKENQSYVFELHSERTIKRLTEIVSKTDFNGVSGRIKFVEGPSRFPVINIRQNIDGKTQTVGYFHPNISEETNLVKGGNLVLNTTDIKWLFGKIPDDGSFSPYDCNFPLIAGIFDLSCEGSNVVFIVAIFMLFFMLISILFYIWKRRYDKRLMEQEILMKSLGIDLEQTYDSASLDKWEIPRENVVINRKIGEGAFGTVYGGEAFFDGKGWLGVAVKTLKIGSSTEEKLNFLSEVEVMKRFDHKNIVQLLAVVLKNEPVLTIMEFMLYGDLKTYLLARRHLINKNQDHNSKIHEDMSEISNKKLTAMALDAAKALSYLAQLKYVHRDVASRNCLVNDQRVVKLGDFGMTRPMYENDYYKFSRKAMLPVRWMAPESLELGVFTPASDIWSYGVLLYEIITFGSFPFQGMSNNQVLTYVKSGNSLVVPKGVKSQLEDLMVSCWSKDPSKRPTAPKVVEFLTNYPRVIAPSLDVPLASVQLEHTGQIEMRMDSTNRQPSFPWSEEDARCQIGSNLPLVNISNSFSKNENVNDMIGIECVSDLESTKPLLSIKTDSVPSTSSNTSLNYVNMPQSFSRVHF